MILSLIECDMLVLPVSYCNAG